MDFQRAFDAMSDLHRRDRSRYHLTLSDAIARLEALDDEAPIQTTEGDGLGRPHSYRGYYSDLSLEPQDKSVTVGDLLIALREARGKTYQGYKGGDFLMDDRTPLWCAHYGCTGLAIMGIEDRGGVAVVILKDVEGD